MADPTGERGLVKKNLEQLVAESATFQTAVGATGTPAEKIAASKGYIHRTAYLADSETGFTRPFALISSASDDETIADATSQVTHGGSVELWFEADIAEGDKDDPQDAEIAFENFYEAVMAEIMTLSANAGYLLIRQWSVIAGPAQEEIEEGEYVQRIRLKIDWGLE